MLYLPQLWTLHQSTANEVQKKRGEEGSGCAGAMWWVNCYYYSRTVPGRADEIPYETQGMQRTCEVVEGKIKEWDVKSWPDKVVVDPSRWRRYGKK